jgi:CubicO group peptidase (beta-lactamase class C family)
MHAAEIPAANGISNAPSLARMYAATIGEVDGANGKVRLISEAMMQRASAPITRPDEIDLCLMRKTNFGMGYMTPTALMPLSGPQSFGHSGAGGSISFGDPVRNLAFSYVMNRMGSYLFTDTRASSLIAAASRCADAF